jgi:predicted ester cyclase
MGSTNTIEWLISKAASEKLKFSIKKAFRIANNRKVRRFSKMKYDAHVAEFICRLGYDGYYAPRLRTKYPQGHFSSETVLCNPSKFLRVSNVFTPTRPPTNKRGRHGLNLANMNYKISS